MIPGDKRKWKHMGSKFLGCSKSTSERKFYSNTGLTQESRKISSKRSNFTPTRTRQRRMKPKFSTRKEITKITADVNEIETKI